MPSRLLIALLSVFGPVLVVGASLRACATYVDRDEAQAERNAGRILNGTVADRSTAAVIERVLARRPPQVLVLGPSYANTDVDVALLSRRLGVPSDAIVLLSVPNSVGAHWYAMLKYRLFERGRRPDVVVIVSGLQSMLLAAPLTEASFVNLQVHLPPGGDPVVTAKTRSDTTLLWARLRAQRGKIRAALFDALRDLSVSWLVPGRDGRPTGPTEARAALDRVFDDARIDMQLHGHTSPVQDVNDRPDPIYTPDMLPPPEDSFLREITALCRAAGTRIVWVRPPMSPHIPAHRDDVVPDGFQERAAALVEGEGGRYVDMRALPMTGAMFRNEDHMNEEGSRRFTEALAIALTEIEAVRAGMTAATLPARPVYVASPVAVPGATRDVTDLPDDVAAFETERWTFLSDEALLGQTGFRTRCSPLRITEDGALLSPANVPCQEVRSLGHGRSCHTTDRIFFTAPDGSDPARNGRSYALVLDPGHRCDDAAWIYPIDILSIALPAPQEEARWLQVDARYVNFRASDLRVRLVADGRVVLDAVRDGRTFHDGPARWPLDPPIAPGAEVTLELENHGHVFYLLTGVALSSRLMVDSTVFPAPSVPDGLPLLTPPRAPP